jgi:hypothetical protein
VDNDPRPVTPRQDDLPRRPYRTPQLVTYGPLAKLTRGAGSGIGEATPTGAMMMCL